MKNKLKFLFIASFLIQFSFGNCQNIEVEYYKDISKSKPVDSRKKAKFEEIKTECEDNFVTIEFKRIKDNQLINYKAYKNNIPHGVWKFNNHNEKEASQLDYDFDIRYSKEKIENAIYFDFASGELITKDIADFSAPKFISRTGNPQAKLYKTIRYPSYALENGIMGEVKVQIKIDSEGNLSIVSIFEGKEVNLDKEAARGLRECQGWEPAKLNGQKVDSYSIVTVKFRLE